MEGEAPEGERKRWLSLAGAATVLKVEASEVLELLRAGRLVGESLRDVGDARGPYVLIDVYSACALRASWDAEEKEAAEISARPVSDAEIAGPLGDAGMEVMAEHVGISKDDYDAMLADSESPHFSPEAWARRLRDDQDGDS
jgi:hypothetical protein